MIPFESQVAADIEAWLGMPLWHVPAVQIPGTTEAAWLASRGGTIGASEIGIIQGTSSFCSPYALWFRKKLDWRLPRTEGQRWGHLVEDPIATLFAEEHPELYVAEPLGAPWSVWVDREHPWMSCTPDRLAVDRDGRILPVELKSDEGGPGWGALGTDEVPAHHRAQLLWQCRIFGAPGGWLVRHRGSGKGRLVSYWIEYDEAEAQAAIADGWDFFWSMHHDEPPEPDGSKSTTEALKEINPAIDEGGEAEIPPGLFGEWVASRLLKKEATAKEELLSNQLRQAMGRAEYASLGGRRFAKRSISKRAGYSVPPGTQDKLLEVITDGQRATAGDLPAKPGGEDGEGPGLPREADQADPSAGAPHEEEGDGGGDDEAGELAAGTDSPGVALSEEQIDELVWEAERGYDPARLRLRHRTVETVHLPEEEKG